MTSRYTKFVSFALTAALLFSAFATFAPAARADPPVDWVTFKYDDFGDANMNNLLQKNGAAAFVHDSVVNADVLRLTPTTNGVFGAVFNKARIYNTDNFSFSTSFAFRISDPGGNGSFPSGADGITFTVQTYQSNAGSVGDGIGYGGIAPSLAVKFDTFDNEVNTGQHQDPSDNYVGLGVNGSVDNRPDIHPDWFKAIDKTQMDMKDGQVHYAWIDYDGLNKEIKVYTGNTDDRSAATLQIDADGIDLGTIFNGYSSVFAGFTAATGSSWENHDIESWYFTNKLDPIDKAAHTYMQAPTSVNVTSEPTDDQGKTKLIITAKGPDGNPVPNVPVSFSGDPVITDTNGDPITSPPGIVTDENGRAEVFVDLESTPTDNPGPLTVVVAGGAYTSTAMPSTPTNPRSGTTPETASLLTWDVVPGASYNVYDNGVLIATVYTNSFDASELTAGVSHRLTVSAVVGGIESGPSGSVMLPKPVGLQTDQSSYDLTLGQTHPTVVSVVYSDGTIVDVSEWTSFSSADTNVATVDGAGTVTAQGLGSTVITATYGGRSTGADVRVALPAPTGLEAGQVTSTGTTLHWNPVPGADSYTLYDNGLPVAENIANTRYTVKNLTPGTDHVFTVAASGGGQTYSPSTAVNVTTGPDEHVTDLLIEQDGGGLTPGDTHQLTTSVVLPDQSVHDVTDRAYYDSSDSNVATVDENGVVTAVGPGTATITVSYGGKTATETIAVQSGRPPFTVTLSASPDAAKGDGRTPVTITASVVSTSGAPVEGVPVVFQFGNGSSGDQTVTTGADGKAAVTFTAPEIVGTLPVNETIVATATDPQSGLQLQKGIAISYMPASVKGVLTDQAGHKIAGATVSVTADFDNDGVPDFTRTVVTGDDGSYQVDVPRGDWDYTLHIKGSSQIGNDTVPIETTQLAHVGALSGNGDSYYSNNTISGHLYLGNSGSVDPQTSVEKLFGGGNVGVSIRDAGDGGFRTNVPLDAEGNFNVDGIPTGSYTIAYEIKAPDGTVLAGPSVNVTISDGGMAVVNSLIDPYGVVTDPSTGDPVSGVKLSLYWADTPLNIRNGHKPNTLVELPELPDFAPNKNHNPQTTGADGEYGWMVYPNGDYYIVASKSGYNPYSTLDDKPNRPAEDGSDSYIRDGIIHVGQSLVSFSFSLVPPSGYYYIPDVNGIAAPSAQAGAATATEVPLSWSAVTGASGYNVYDNGVLVASGVTGTEYRVTGLTAGTSHLFTVTAIVGGIESAPSAEVAVTTLAAAGLDSQEDQGQHERYVNGYPDGTFKPGQSITREEAAAMLFRALKLSPADDSQSGLAYADVPDSDWGFEAIAAVSAHGIMKGYPDGSFRPRQTITREEMASIAARVKQLDGDSAAAFPDARNSWAAADIGAAASAGLVGGYPDGTFKPHAHLTRAEAVTIVNHLAGRGPLTGVPSPTWSDVSPSYWAYGDIEEASIDHSYVIKDGTEQWQAPAQP